MTPVARIHPARRTLLAIVVGVREGSSRRAAPDRDLIIARVAFYRGRDREPLGLELELSYPASGAYRPDVGDRMSVAIEPSEA